MSNTGIHSASRIIRKYSGFVLVIWLLLSSGIFHIASQPATATLESEFSTDFTLRSIDLDEIRSGGPPKDGIPAIDSPEFSRLEENSPGLTDNEMVIAVSMEGVHKIYPLRILIWHEIVNDTIAGTPIAVTWCPLCNSALVFNRRISHEGRSLVLDFGTTGRLRYSNLLMYDRQTETWWQQGSGRALIGKHTGTQLEILPSTVMSFKNASRVYSGGMVLKSPEDSARAYGMNPYRGYEDSSMPLLYNGPDFPGDQPPMLDRAVVVHNAGENPVTIGYARLRAEPFMELNSADNTVYLIYDPDARSPLDRGRVNTGRQVGTANAFLDKTTEGRKVDLQLLTLNALDSATDSEGISSDQLQEYALNDGRLIFDRLSSTIFDANGLGVMGPLTGSRLSPGVSVQHFWFSATIFAGNEGQNGLFP
ncbi:DUF3179 domain-containing protein [Salinispira pacifica]|uniref:DUF3179 domain-containing protein n=1 Tax=Salinispira pacifica TaxID=1307761 RepID=V5WDM5_9SPIO|nr:DUF3179 domain-containing protein [Salinispira pacifica]AHC13913.1 hypothetical protein L21SP2_0481 [Salinispira pacifica]